MCSYYKKQDNKTMQWCLLTTPPHHVVVFTFHHRILTGSIFTQYRNSFLVGDVEKIYITTTLQFTTAFEKNDIYAISQL